jgi:hypothetical protein
MRTGRARRASPRSGWRSYHLQSRESSASRGSSAQYCRVIAGHVERRQHQSHLRRRGVETWLRGRVRILSLRITDLNSNSELQTFLSLIKDARGSFLYGFIL